MDGTVGPTRWYEFTTSGIPTGGTCSIAPADGEYLLTIYSVMCTGYTDDNLPLTYTIVYVDPVTGEGQGHAYSR